MKPKLLNVGSGSVRLGTGRFTDTFEIHTLDKDERVKPTFVGDICSMPLEGESYEAVIAHHVLEHVVYRDVGRALSEFYRVLKPGGELFIEVPNLDYACELILQNKGFVPVYTHKDPSGFVVNVTPMDMVYGWSKINNDNGLYSHLSGFNRGMLFSMLGVFDWYMLRSYEHRMLGEYDRCSVRAYGVKPGQATHEYVSDWMREGPELDCGDPYVLKGGMCDAIPSQENNGRRDQDSGSVYRA